MADDENEHVIDERFEWNACGNTCTPISSYLDVLKLKCFRPAWQNNILKLSNVSVNCFSGKDLHCHEICIDLPKHRKKRSNVPKTLFCHDLKGGYLEDRFVHGSKKHDEYRFFHWAGIDTFIYFSHQLVTIPPPVWINSAHLHGTKVLGTLITEWDDGKKIWEEILKSDSTVEDFVDSLVTICYNFGFDGYLINVENVIPMEHIGKLELFVSLLHSKLHSKIPHAEVLWYDSVTNEGKLKWQNELNDRNRIFFDNCDGIFLNYTWSEEDLKNSAEIAGSRHLDVYVGVDVFGRNCYGGGHFNTYQAVEVARKHNLSLALFAPSWVHEYFGGSYFVHLEYVFWQKLWPYLYIRGPTQLPFRTTFCQGYGEKMYHNGLVTCNSSWYNLSKQQYQPTVPSCLNDSFVDPVVKSRTEEGSISFEKQDILKLISVGCIQHYPQDAFTGGGCLQVCQLSKDRHSQRIFTCSFESRGEVLISFASKPNSEDNTSINVVLLTEDSNGVCSWVLMGQFSNKSKSDMGKTGVHHVFPKTEKEIADLKETVKGMAHDQLSLTAGSGWKLRHYLLELHETIVDISVELCGPGTAVLLGLFSIIPLE
ncbi:cytosolic endo-beta-N-acetylglucosaminidase isoform X2 [Periplaneta americana]|uniref:cytosolic endo-beta-N-acetylglucosaminidase isoform X2 n=1 Tax=Periplaneta americana TaxID=6978 RepID=UPI0037E8E6A8